MRGFFSLIRKLWGFSVVRHIVSASAAVAIATSGQKAGLDPQTADQLGKAAGEIVRTIPVEPEGQ